MDLRAIHFHQNSTVYTRIRQTRLSITLTRFPSCQRKHILLRIVTIYVGLTSGFGLVDRFIDHLYTLLGATSIYNAIADLHTLQITTATAKPFSSLLCLHQPFPANGF
jgi:hypothetical protein